MTDEELRESTRNNFYTQLERLGYGRDGLPLEDRITVIRCKNCAKKGKPQCPVMHIGLANAPGYLINSIVKHYWNNGTWFCAEGVKKDD